MQENRIHYEKELLPNLYTKTVVTKELIKKAELKLPKHDECPYDEYHIIFFEDFTEPVEIAFSKIKDGWAFKCVCQS